MDIKQKISGCFQRALVAAFGEQYASVDPLINPSNNAKFGDYQANVAMSLAKKLKQKPRDVAQAILEHLQMDELCDKLEIAGPGFINITLRNDYLAKQLEQLRQDPHLAIEQTQTPQTIVVDYSGPNVAKEMHVGHLRSTVIGDAIVRLLKSQGHHVIPQNHLGDWGTQFGMLIEHMLDHQSDVTSGIADLEVFYRTAKLRFDDEPEFADRARKRVVALQSGDRETLARWSVLIEESKKHFNRVYQQLGVLLTDKDIRAESFYNTQLAEVICSLEEAKLLGESRGAKVVFPDGFVDADDQPMPMIVQKTDGGYLYATTDLAAARYRMKTLNARRLVYVTDSRQSLHFAMLFQTLRQAKWATKEMTLTHVPFGTVLGKDKKPFKTRTGGTVKLADLIVEAQRRAVDVLAEKKSNLDKNIQQHITQVVAISALKYADLSGDRIKDYVFDWDRMLAMEGNTAPYLLYCYARIHAIFRKGGVTLASLEQTEMVIDEAAEKNLALKILQFGQAVGGAAEVLEPHRVCTYLYELATCYHQFYEHCPVLIAKTDEQKQSRLALSALAARVLQAGLDLLGIDVLEQM